ncbi:MAG: mismatch-specific DNA-glycosylase [Candidatus Binataceae bacterium]
MRCECGWGIGTLTVHVAKSLNMPLPDLMMPHPRILFVGINPSLRSERVGHHFAGPGNPFWRLLYAAGLILEPLGHEQDARITEFGLALTNLCPRATRAASELGSGEINLGKHALINKIERLSPEVVAFVGISIYRQFFKASAGGAGPKPERIAGVHIFVLPNPSGLNASFPGFTDKLVWFKRLREFVESMEHPG